MTDEIRIGDLAAPVYTDDQRRVLDYGESAGVGLDAAELCDAARRRTGLDDFGADDFLARLRAQVAAVEADAGLNGLGRLIVHRRFVRLLSQRLLMHDLLKHRPEIDDIELEPPVIVVGLPRSGTTHLVNLLAADTRFRSLPFWESLEPFPGLGDGPPRDGVDPRYRRCAADYEAQMTMAPLVRAMHHQYPEAIEEEIEVQDLDFASYTLEWHARVAGWRDAYRGIDQTRSYAFLKRALQALAFLRGPRRWVLKSPQHLEQLPALQATFPDATIVFTHRDPVGVIASAVTMLAYGDRMRRYAIEPQVLARYWIDRIEALLRACVRDRDLVPAARSVDVLFHELTADEDIATVASIYDTAGIETDDAAEHALRSFVADNPRGKHGRVVYDLEGDFGFDPARVRERFAFYFDRFPVEAE